MLIQSDKKKKQQTNYINKLYGFLTLVRNETIRTNQYYFDLFRQEEQKKAWEKIIAKTLAVTFDRHKNKTYFYLPTLLRETPKKTPTVWRSTQGIGETDGRLDGAKPLKSKRRSNRSLRSLIKSCKCKCFVPILSVFCFDKNNNSLKVNETPKCVEQKLKWNKIQVFVDVNLKWSCHFWVSLSGRKKYHKLPSVLLDPPL